MNTKKDNIYLAKMTLFFSVVITLILVSLTSLWLSRVVFNTEQFTNTTVAAFSEPTSRESVGDMVAARIFDDRPALRSLLSEKLSNYVSSLLATESAQSSVERLSRQGQLLFTSPQRDPVTLELYSLKPIIASAQELVQEDETQRRISVEDIPDSITIIDTAALPNFHSVAVYVHLAGPLMLFAVILLSSYWLKRGGMHNIYKRSRILMLVVLASSGIALLVGPLFEPSFISLGRDAPSQTLLSNLYKSFIALFTAQAMWLGIAASASLIIATTWYEFNRRYTITLKVTKK